MNYTDKKFRYEVHEHHPVVPIVVDKASTVKTAFKKLRQEEGRRGRAGDLYVYDTKENRRIQVHEKHAGCKACEGRRLRY